MHMGTQNKPINYQKAVYKALIQLGLTERETTLYMTSLAVGPCPLAELAEQMGISRPNIYKLVKGLESKGLAVMPSRGKHRRFSVLSPTSVSEMLENKKRDDELVSGDFRALLPQLLTTYRRGDLPSNVSIYVGRKQYYNAFFSILKEAKEYCDFFGSADDFLSLFDAREQHFWLKERVSRGIRANTLILPGQQAELLKREDETSLRETRVLRDMKPFKGSVHFFADKIMLWQPESLLAIRIEDDLIYHMLRNVFDFLWQKNR